MQKPGPPPPEPAWQRDPRGRWGGPALCSQPPSTMTPGGTVLHASSGFCPFEGMSTDSCQSVSDRHVGLSEARASTCHPAAMGRDAEGWQTLTVPSGAEGTAHVPCQPSRPTPRRGALKTLSALPAPSARYPAWVRLIKWLCDLGYSPVSVNTGREGAHGRCVLVHSRGASIWRCTLVEVQVPRPLPQRAPSPEPAPLATAHHVFRLWPQQR